MSNFASETKVATRFENKRTINFFDVMNKEKQEEMRLLKSFVCSLAMRLYGEESVSIKEAFKRAHLVKDLLEKLGQGKVTFQYEKQDGTLREAQGTLRRGIDPVFDAYEYKNDVRTNQNPDSTNFTYWDLEAHGFRTFSAARVVKIIAVAIPNYKEHELHESHELIEFV